MGNFRRKKLRGVGEGELKKVPNQILPPPDGAIWKGEDRGYFINKIKHGAHSKGKVSMTVSDARHQAKGRERGK